MFVIAVKAKKLKSLSHYSYAIYYYNDQTYMWHAETLAGSLGFDFKHFIYVPNDPKFLDR